MAEHNIDVLDESVRKELLSKENVFAVGVGESYTNNTLDDHLAITIRVDEKVDESNLNDADIIPTEIDGVPTDVIAKERPTVDDFETNAHGLRRDEVRPVVGGLSVQSSNIIGSLGGVFDDSNGNRVLLTAEHIVEDRTDVYQGDDQIGTVQQTYPDYDIAVVDITTESEGSSRMLGLCDIGSQTSATVGEWYTTNGDRTGWHGEKCVAVDLTFSGYDGLWNEYNRAGYSNGSGNSGALYGKYDKQNDVFHPVSHHSLGTSTSSYGQQLDEFEKEAGSFTPSSNTNEPSGDPNSDAYFDNAVTDINYRNADREFDVTLIYGNTGGGNSTDDTLYIKDGSRTIDKFDFSAGSLEMSATTRTLDNQYGGTELYAETRDNDQSVFTLPDAAKYNLSITSISPSNPSVGDNVDIDIKIENVGSADSNPVTVETDVGLKVTRSDDIALNAGSSKTVTYTIDTSVFDPGTIGIGVVSPTATAFADFELEEGNFELKSGFGLAEFGGTSFGGDAIDPKRSIKYIFRPDHAGSSWGDDWGDNWGGKKESTIVTSGDLINHSPVRVDTGKGDCRATFTLNRSLDNNTKRQDRVDIEIDGTVVWSGFALGTKHDYNRDTTTVRFDGIAKRLEETRPDEPVTFEQTALDNAIEYYWDLTPFDNVTVYDEDTTIIDDNAQIFSANKNNEFLNVVDSEENQNNEEVIADRTAPVKIQNDNIELLETCDARDALDQRDEAINTGFTNGDEYNDGQAALFSGSAFIDFEITFNHRIPVENVGIALRSTNIDDDFNRYVEWNGTRISEANAVSVFLDWYYIGQDEPFSATLGGYADEVGEDIKTGETNTLRVGTEGPNDYILDCVAVFDNRFNYRFPNPDAAENNGGLLEGPQLYPDAYTFELAEQPVAYNINSLSGQIALNELQSNQSFGLSNNGGNSYQTTSSTAFNPTFTTAGRSARANVRLVRYGSQDTYPTQGSEGQKLQAINVDGTLSDRTVIDELTLSRDHFSNLKTLHDYGDFVWAIDHSGTTIANMPVESFDSSGPTKSRPDEFSDPIDKTIDIEGEEYYNKIYVEGAERPDGSRPSATAIADESVINEDGREISPGVVRDPKITTETGAQYRAEALLKIAQDNQFANPRLKTMVTDIITPGYNIAVDVDDDGNEENIRLKRVELSESNDMTTITWDFTRPLDLSRRLEKLSKTQRDIGDRV